MKKVILLIGVVLIILAVVINALFPYSFLSVNKSVGFKPIKNNSEYKKELDSLNKIIHKRKSDTETNLALKNSVEFLSQKWLTQNSSVKVTKKQAKQQTVKLTALKKEFGELSEKEDYNGQTRTDLESLYNNYVSLLQLSNNINASHFKTRYYIRDKLQLFKESLFTQMQLLKVFYEDSIDKS